MSRKSSDSQNTRSQYRDNKKKASRFNFRTVLGVILIIVALGLFALDPIKNYMIRQGTEQNTVANIDRETILANQEYEATYNWDDIEQLDAFSVLTDDVKAGDLPVVGGIAMPDLGMNLPIHKGVSNAGMYLGAGTLYADQEMGFSNYSLASHHSVHDELLFAPLMNVEYGQTIYLTDLEYVYIYEVDFIENVPATSVELTFPTDSARVTLITCDYDLIERVVVQGALVDSVHIEDANQDMLEAFNIPQTSTANL